MDTRRREVEALLVTVPMFADGGRAAAGHLARSATVIEAPRGTVLFRRDEPSQGIYFVVSGQVKLSIRTPAGAELVVALIGPGESFGESTMFLGLPHATGAETLAATRLVHVPIQAVLSEVRRNAEFAHRIILALSGRLHLLISGLEGYALRSGTQRVAGYLLGQLPATGTTGALTLPAQKRIIASQLNLTQEHFSRILHELIAKGLIDVRGKTVTVHEFEALQAEAAGRTQPKNFLADERTAIVTKTTARARPAQPAARRRRTTTTQRPT